MIGALIAIVSLNLTLSLVQAGQVALTLPITAASQTTPIQITSAAHGIPLGRAAHGVVSGVLGTTEANGLWVLTPLDANTLALSTYTPQGLAVQSVGVNAYSGGGVVSVAFPDYSIMLGRRNVALGSAVASPRIVFVPTDGKAWDLEPYGGQGPAPRGARGSLEQQAQTTQPQLATSFPTFDVFVTGAASPPSPDFGDFDATQAIVDALFAVLFDTFGASRARVLHDGWPSQDASAGTQTQRGQRWKGRIELQHPVTKAPLSFVPHGTSLVFTVQPVNAGSSDGTIITVL